MYYDYFRLLYGDMLNGMFYIEELVSGFFWPSKHRFFSVSPPPLIPPLKGGLEEGELKRI